MEMDKTPAKVQMTVAVGITGLSAWGLYLGYNGIIFGTALALLAGLGGYSVGKEQIADIAQELQENHD